MNDRSKGGSKTVISRCYVLLTIAVVLIISVLSACTPKTLTGTITQTTSNTATRTEQTQTTTATEIPITSTNTTTTVTSLPLTTTAQSTVISTLPLDSLDHPEVSRITAEELKILIDKYTPLVIVDSRDSSSFNISHIPGALSVPYDTVINSLAMDLKLMSLPKDRLIVFYCD